MTSEPVRSGSICVLHVFKIFFPSLCIRLQQSDESENKAQSQSNTLVYFGEYVPFQIAVQILRCNNQHYHHQKAPKHKEKGKNGLTDPEDLEKKWSFFYFRILGTFLTPLDLKDNQLARVYRGTVEDRVKRWVVSARVAVVIEASCFVVPDDWLIVIWFIGHIFFTFKIFLIRAIFPCLSLWQFETICPSNQHCSAPAKFAQPITGAVHEVQGGEVEDEDEAGQQGEAQENSHLTLQPNLGQRSDSWFDLRTSPWTASSCRSSCVCIICDFD